MPTDWLRVMLEEVAQKRLAAERARHEAELRRRSLAPAAPVPPAPARA